MRQSLGRSRFDLHMLKRICVTWVVQHSGKNAMPVSRRSGTGRVQVRPPPKRNANRSFSYNAGVTLLNDPRNTAITTLVCYHDLLGFGDLLSAAGGALDTAVGEIAYRRITGLQQSVVEVKDRFPAGTQFFHFNDTVTAYRDIDISIRSSHTDSGGIAAQPMSHESCLTLLRFIGAAAYLHHRSISREENERTGPAGRTFVVLGKRWHIPSPGLSDVADIPNLEANIAFAEAYLADASGSRSGFTHGNLNRLYVNDHIWMLLYIASVSLGPAEKNALSELGLRDKPFPHNLVATDAKSVIVETFHRPREYHSLMSHHARDIAEALDRGSQNAQNGLTAARD